MTRRLSTVSHFRPNTTNLTTTTHAGSSRRQRQQRRALGGGTFLCVSRTEWVLTVAGGDFDYRPVRTALDVHDRDDGGEQQLRVAARPTTRHPQLARISRPLARHVDAGVGSKAKPSFRPVQRLGLSTRMVSRPPFASLTPYMPHHAFLCNIHPPIPERFTF